MTKNEIIKKTLEEMHGENGLLCPNPHEAENDTSDDYESSIVVPMLVERLPEGVDIKTCSDFRHLKVDCCKTCHTLYAHYEMHLESIAHSGNAWLCCFIRAALRGDNPLAGENSQETFDLEAILGGGLRKGSSGADTDDHKG